MVNKTLYNETLPIAKKYIAVGMQAIIRVIDGSDAVKLYDRLDSIRDALVCAYCDGLETNILYDDGTIELLADRLHTWTRDILESCFFGVSSPALSEYFKLLTDSSNIDKVGFALDRKYRRCFVSVPDRGVFRVIIRDRFMNKDDLKKFNDSLYSDFPLLNQL